jgi:hypothetical protein
MKELTTEESKFVAAYLSNGNNGTEAFLTIRPDCKRTTARIEGSRIKHRPHVSAALQAHNQSIVVAGKEEAVISKAYLIDTAKWGIEACKEDRELGTLFKGVDVAAKLTGSYDSEEDDESKYAKFITKISINELTINQGVNTKEPKVVGENTTSSAPCQPATIDGQCATIPDAVDPTIQESI